MSKQKSQSKYVEDQDDYSLHSTQHTLKAMSVTEATQYMSMDADTTGHYLCVLADWHSVLDQRVRDQKYVATEMQMTDLYLLGNIEGRLLHGFVTAVDIEMIEEWEHEVPTRWNEGVGEF